MGRIVSGIAFTTLLTSLGLWTPETTNPEIRRVNEDESLLSYWPSEDYHSDALPECDFYNFSVIYSSELCTHFVVSRFSSTPIQAFKRATKCAALHKVECILSPEIGLAVPAAFVVPNAGNLKMILTPRVLHSTTQSKAAQQQEQEQQQQYVRVHQPSSGLLTHTRTLKFNHTIHVEYMDGRSRTVRTEHFNGSDAYCIQLLRLAFVPECWRAMD